MFFSSVGKSSKNEWLLVRNGCISLILFSRGDDLLEQTPKESNGRSGQGAPNMSYPVKEWDVGVTVP